jgi:hypothetical protein
MQVHVDAASSRLGQMLACLADHGMAGEGLHQLSLSPTRCKHGGDMHGIGFL